MAAVCRMRARSALIILLFIVGIASIVTLLSKGTGTVLSEYLPVEKFMYRAQPRPPRLIEKAECIFPDVNPFDPNVLRMAGLGQVTLKCDGDFMPEMTYIDGLSIKVNASKTQTKSGFSHCKYRNITRTDFEDYSVVFSNWSEPFSKSVEITEAHEFLHVVCYGEKMKEQVVVSKAFYSLVPKRAHLKALYDVRNKKRKVEFNTKETLNIIGVALDGLPRHQMIRAMPQTYKLLTERFGSFDFRMHSQVGSGTFPNFLALLSENTRWEVGKWWNFKKPQDAFDLLWHDVETAGYRTLYTEDYPRGAGFYWSNRSFLYPQTSYWNRPLQLAMLDEPGFIRRNASCAGPRAISQYQLEYLMRFLDTFPKDPVAGMSFIINLTHDDSTKAGLIDEHIRDFYEALHSKGHLDRSLVMFFSDHGNRWGKIRETYNGVTESKNPFLILTFPPWFLKKYPDVAENLRVNTHRLTTHSDTRQMLLDLLYFKAREPTPPFRGRHGTSLFKELPKNRTCGDASIPEDQCLCGQKVLRHVGNGTALAARLGKTLLTEVKKKSDPDVCEEYRLDKILQIGVLSMPTASAKEKKRHTVYRVRITVLPGGAMFEGIVSIDKTKKRTSVGPNIERLNMYKGEVECRPSSKEQIYCYCLDNQ